MHMKVYRGCSSKECDNIRNGISDWPTRHQKYSHGGIKGKPCGRFSPLREYAEVAPQEECLLEVDLDDLAPCDWGCVNDQGDVDIVDYAILRLGAAGKIVFTCP